MKTCLLKEKSLIWALLLSFLGEGSKKASAARILPTKTKYRLVKSLLGSDLVIGDPSYANICRLQFNIDRKGARTEFHPSGNGLFLKNFYTLIKVMLTREMSNVRVMGIEP